MRASSQSRWDERIARARHLADRHPAAADILSFYATLAEYQQSLAARWARAGRPAAGAQPDSRGTLELAVLSEPTLEAVADFLTWLGNAAPPRLAGAVGALGCLDRSAWRVVLDEYLHSTAHTPRGGDPGPRSRSETAAADAPRVFVIEALLQPLAERLAVEWRLDRPTSPPAAASSRCPVCNDLPVVGVLREEGEGAKRSLVCGLCLTEWPYFRLVCPGCGEGRFDALPVFTSDQAPGARVEVCDTCRRYIKTIDLTRDGHAIPCVDDLATVSLDLWAREQGYARLRLNLLMT